MKLTNWHIVHRKHCIVLLLRFKCPSIIIQCSEEIVLHFILNLICCGKIWEECPLKMLMHHMGPLLTAESNIIRQIAWWRFLYWQRVIDVPLNYLKKRPYMNTKLYIYAVGPLLFKDQRFLWNIYIITLNFSKVLVFNMMGLIISKKTEQCNIANYPITSSHACILFQERLESYLKAFTFGFYR